MVNEIPAYAIRTSGGKWLQFEQVEGPDVCVIITKHPLGMHLFSFEDDAQKTIDELTRGIQSQWDYDVCFEKGDLRIVPVTVSYDDNETVIS